MAKPMLIIVGNGMVGHKLVELLIQAEATHTYDITVFGEERHTSPMTAFTSAVTLMAILLPI